MVKSKPNLLVTDAPGVQAVVFSVRCPVAPGQTSPPCSPPAYASVATSRSSSVAPRSIFTAPSFPTPMLPSPHIHYQHAWVGSGSWESEVMSGVAFRSNSRRYRKTKVPVAEKKMRRHLWFSLNSLLSYCRAHAYGYQTVAGGGLRGGFKRPSEHVSE